MCSRALIVGILVFYLRAEGLDEEVHSSFLCTYFYKKPNQIELADSVQVQW